MQKNCCPHKFSDSLWSTLNIFNNFVSGRFQGFSSQNNRIACGFAWEYLQSGKHYRAGKRLKRLGKSCSLQWKKFFGWTGDCNAMLKGFRMLFWTHVSGVQSYISIWEVNLIRWCGLNADRRDCLCDRQVAGLDGVCKLQWNDFFESFCFLWTPSCVMAQMWRDRM